MSQSVIKPNQSKTPRYLHPRGASSLTSALSVFSGSLVPIALLGCLVCYFLFSYVYDVRYSIFLVSTSIILVAMALVAFFRMFHSVLANDTFALVAADFSAETISISPWELVESKDSTLADFYRQYKHRSYTKNMMFQHILDAFNTITDTDSKTRALLKNLAESMKVEADADEDSTKNDEPVLRKRQGTKGMTPSKDASANETSVVETPVIPEDVFLPLLTGKYKWRSVMKSLGKCEQAYKHLNAEVKLIYFFVPPSQPSATPTVMSSLLANTIEDGMELEVLLLPPAHATIAATKALLGEYWQSLCLLALEHIDGASGVHGVQTVADEDMISDNPKKYKAFSAGKSSGIYSDATLDPYNYDMECINRDFPEVVTSLLDFSDPKEQFRAYQSVSERSVPNYGTLTAEQLRTMCNDDEDTSVSLDDDDTTDDIDKISSNTVLNSTYAHLQRLELTEKTARYEEKFLASVPQITLAHRYLANMWLLDAKHIGVVCSSSQMIGICRALGITDPDLKVRSGPRDDWRVFGVMGMRLDQ